ncbi:unnamed protein product [Nezara viridula]|uniref:Uncharacterized protein n=1 Tax=Nezara viridula TaxID=85310 RepID=A0A9P0H129_NEZVI|nr:unnamed protein product [Nezara viridula]
MSEIRGTHASRQYDVQGGTRSTVSHPHHVHGLRGLRHESSRTDLPMIVLYQHYHLRESLPAIISELEDMDQLIGNVSYRGYHNYRMVVLSILNALPRVFEVFHKPFTWNLLLSRSLYFSFCIIPVLISGQYSILLHIISRQLQTLSEKLNKAAFCLEVMSLIDVHHNLVLLANRINRAFDIFLFHLITFIFVINTLKLYFMIVYIVKPDSYIDIALTITSVLDFVVNYGSLITVIFAAMDATKTAGIFNAQLLKNLLISKTIAKDMAAGTTTYVILLVQFTLL